MLGIQRSGQSHPPALFHPAISIGDDGLVCGAGSILVRMARAGGLASWSRTMPPVSSRCCRLPSTAASLPPRSCRMSAPAAEHWARGDKAIANFRLTFARSRGCATRRTPTACALPNTCSTVGFRPTP